MPAGAVERRAPPGPPGRPATGPGHYLRDLVYGATDGVVTTLAVVAGVAGAGFSPGIAVVLGLANLAADGLSMGAGNYLALRSELEQTGASIAEEKPARHGLATAGAFVAAGAVPLAAYALPPVPGLDRFAVAALLGGLALLLAGAARAPLLRRPAWSAGLEMLAVGGVAALVAWVVGRLAEGLAGG